MKSDAYRYGLWLLVAVGVHLALLFGPWGFLRREAVYNASDVEGIEVSIVDSAPGTPAEAAPAPVAAPPVAAVEPNPVPPPPLPGPVAPVPEPEPMRPPEKPEPKPRVERPPKTTVAKSTSATPHPHSATPSGSPQTAATGAPGASTSKGAGISGGTGNSSPGYLSNPHPPYPPESKARREQGIVMLAVLINEHGEVTSISVSQSSGFPRLDQAAREGVNHWRFRPARVAGFPVSSHLAVPVRFRLGD